MDAFGFDYLVADGPYVSPVPSVPLPAGLELMMAALAVLLSVALLKRGRAGALPAV